MTTLEAQHEVNTNLILENQKLKQERDELREELEILRSNKMSDPLLETTFKHLIRERDEAIIKYTEEANELERQRNHAIAKCEDARRDLAEAKEALKKIKHIFINGGDTYLDFVKVGNIATDYLEGYWAEQLLDVCKTTNIISDEQISLDLPEKYKSEFEEFMRGKTCAILENGQRGVYSRDFEQYLKTVLKK